MAYYRVYLLNAVDCIFDGQRVERDSDAAAIVAAARLISDNPAVEIWAGARKVARLTAEELSGILRVGQAMPNSTQGGYPIQLNA